MAETATVQVLVRPFDGSDVEIGSMAVTDARALLEQVLIFGLEHMGSHYVVTKGGWGLSAENAITLTLHMEMEVSDG